MKDIVLWQVQLNQKYLQQTPRFKVIIDKLKRLIPKYKEDVLADIHRVNAHTDEVNKILSSNLYLNDQQVIFDISNNATSIETQWIKLVENNIQDHTLIEFVLHATNQNLLTFLPIDIIQELPKQQLLSLNSSGTVINPDRIYKIKLISDKSVEYNLSYASVDERGKKLYECSGNITISKTNNSETPYKIEFNRINFTAYSPKTKHLFPTLYNRGYLEHQLKQMTFTDPDVNLQTDIKNIIRSAAEIVADYLGCDAFEEFAKQIIAKLIDKAKTLSNRIELLRIAQNIAELSFQTAIKNIIKTVIQPDAKLNKTLLDSYIRDMYILGETNFAAVLQILPPTYLNIPVTQFYRLITVAFNGYKIRKGKSTNEANKEIESVAKLLKNMNATATKFIAELYASLDGTEKNLLNDYINNFDLKISKNLVNVDELNKQIPRRLLLKAIITGELANLYIPTPEYIFDHYLNIIEKIIDLKLLPGETNELKHRYFIKEFVKIIFDTIKGDINKLNDSATIMKIEKEARFRIISKTVYEDLKNFAAHPDQPNNNWSLLYYRLVLPLLNKKPRHPHFSLSNLISCGEIKGPLDQQQIIKMVTQNILIQTNIRSNKLFKDLHHKHKNDFKRKSFYTQCTRRLRIPVLNKTTIRLKPSEEQRNILAMIAALREMHFEHCKELFGNNNPRTLLAKQHFQNSTINGVRNFFADLNLKNKSSDKIFNHYILHQEQLILLLQNDPEDNVFRKEKEFLINNLKSVLNQHRYTLLMDNLDKNFIFIDFNKSWYDKINKQIKILQEGSVDIGQQLAKLEKLKKEGEEHIAQYGFIKRFILNLKLKKLSQFIDELQQHAIKNEADFIHYRLNQIDDPIDTLKIKQKESESPSIEAMNSSALTDSQHKQINTQEEQIARRSESIFTRSNSDDLEKQKLRLKKLCQTVYSGEKPPAQFSALFSVIQDKKSLRKASKELAAEIVKGKKAGYRK